MAGVSRRTAGQRPASVGDREMTMSAPVTEVLEQPTDSTTDNAPEMFHYVRKNKIAESAVMGTHVVALCGEVFPVTKSPKPGSPVCPDCERIYRSLPPGRD
jgi:hypothetical protein